MRQPNANPNRPPSLGADARLHERLAALERQVGILTSFMSGGATAQLPVVQQLPPPGRQGRVLIFAGDGKLYRDDGASWTAIG